MYCSTKCRKKTIKGKEERKDRRKKRKRISGGSSWRVNISRRQEAPHKLRGKRGDSQQTRQSRQEGRRRKKEVHLQRPPGPRFLDPELDQSLECIIFICRLNKLVAFSVPAGSGMKMAFGKSPRGLRRRAVCRAFR